MRTKAYIIFILPIIFSSCNFQSEHSIVNNKTNKKYICDIKTSHCEPSNETEIEEIKMNQENKVKLIYYTDPICSSCWAIEPELKKFKLEYGNYFDIVYKMGGLLKNWDGFSDSGNHISKPSDVSKHWDEVGEQTEMSIDGDVWLEDYLSSSYPPSIAFKAIQMQGGELALTFLRTIREMVFLEKKNITKETFLVQAVEKIGGDTTKFLEDYKNEETKQLFYNEINEGREMGVRGFPTFIFVDESGSGFKLSGMSGYSSYINALEKAYGKEIKPNEIKLSELGLLKKYKFLATKEISVILSQDKLTTISKLNELVEKYLVKKEEHKFSFFWRLIE